MSDKKISDYRKKIKQYGAWAGVRFLRNQGVEFEMAYWIIFDRLPRK